MVIDLEVVSNEILEVLSRNKITYSHMDEVFERTREIAHSNVIDHPFIQNLNKF